MFGGGWGSSPGMKRPSQKAEGWFPKLGSRGGKDEHVPARFKRIRLRRRRRPRRAGTGSVLGAILLVILCVAVAWVGLRTISMVF